MKEFKEYIVEKANFIVKKHVASNNDMIEFDLSFKNLKEMLNKFLQQYFKGEANIESEYASTQLFDGKQKITVGHGYRLRLKNKDCFEIAIYNRNPIIEYTTTNGDKHIACLDGNGKPYKFDENFKEWLLSLSSYHKDLLKILKSV